MTRTIKELNRHYRINITVLAVLFLSALFPLVGCFENSQPVSAVAERYAIAITLIAIPVALKLFAEKIKKVPEKTGQRQAVKLYRRAWFLRLYGMSLLTLGNIVLFALSRNNNFMWLAAVLFVVLAFCKPSFEELENIIEKEENN